MAINIFSGGVSGFGTGTSADAGESFLETIGFGDESEGSGDSSEPKKWFQMDGTIEETHTHSLKVTTTPVQNGAEIATNAVVEPNEITVTGIVTNTPLSLMPTLQGTAAEAVDLINGSDSEKRTETAMRELLTLKNSRELLTVDTGLMQYTNMLITEVGSTANNEMWHASEFIVSFQEMLIPVLDDGGTKDGGVKPPEIVSLSTAVNIFSAVTNIMRGFT